MNIGFIESLYSCCGSPKSRLSTICLVLQNIVGDNNAHQNSFDFNP